MFVFHTYLRQKWIDLRQTKTKMINRPFYTYRPTQSFHQRNMLCFVIIYNHSAGQHIAAASWPYTYLLTVRLC